MNRNIFGATLASLLLIAGIADAQVRVRMPASNAPTTTVFQGSGAPVLSGADYNVNAQGLAPVNGGYGVAAPNGYGVGGYGTTTPFDPYSSVPSTGGIPSTTLGAPLATPMTGPAATFNQPVPYQQPGAPANPYATYPAQPPVLFPNGLLGNGGQSMFGAGGLYGGGQTMRLTQNVRFMQTWVAGDGGSEVDINDSDIAAMFAYPDFLFTNTPLFITPGFMLHVWDGPSNSAADLPSKAFSAYVEAAWKSNNPARMFGAEVNVSVGAYSDFNTVTSDSIRVQGTGLLTLNLTPTVTLRGGVTYLDRLEIKMLPAGGIYWQPNDYTRFDIYFPRPKLSQFWTTVGNSDLWWYIGGEYGGGNWTVERTAGGTDRVDINDIRVMLGLEWTNTNGVTGMFELGYVFERELVYANNPAHNISLNDSFMLRAGLSY